MTWLDERLFGWSRSAHRGTSAWGESSSLETSRTATPDMSDEEEEGDYDNVIDYLGSYMGTSPSEKRLRSKSMRGSYADLQHVKNKESASENQDGQTKSRSILSSAQAQYAPVYQKRPMPQRSPSSFGATETSIAESTSSVGDSPYPNPRKSPRERRSSLSDQVAVEKIGGLNPVNTFKHATEELNRDIAERS
jgi:glycerol-3-phosphate O-acyltransferase / dihydroxyacetone phosphate acyltransferase